MSFASLSLATKCQDLRTIKSNGQKWSTVYVGLEVGEAEGERSKSDLWRLGLCASGEILGYYA